MKKVLLLLATAVGAVAIQRQIQAKKAENRLWAEATDTPDELTPGCRPPASCARARWSRGHGAIGSAPALQAGG